MSIKFKQITDNHEREIQQIYVDYSVADEYLLSEDKSSKFILQTTILMKEI